VRREERSIADGVPPGRNTSPRMKLRPAAIDDLSLSHGAEYDRITGCFFPDLSLYWKNSDISSLSFQPSGDFRVTSRHHVLF